MADNSIVVCSPKENNIKIKKWKVCAGYQVVNGQPILLYELIDNDDKEIKRLKSIKSGVVKKLLCKEGDIVDKGSPILEISQCDHTTVIKDMCADCGADLRQNDKGTISEASVPMVHSVPELKVTQKLAQKLGQADTERLLKEKKLVLLVDLDQTLIHTTNDTIQNNLKDVYHFQLYGSNSAWYHTRLRPGTLQFLKNMAPFYELHICTFGARNYAHTIANFLDKDGKYFSHRILSRDECFNATRKTDNLKALFPCGDTMVCIIDDREDVWNMASNLIQVKPYHFFRHTGDINAPPGMSKNELDGKGIDFNDVTNQQTNKEKQLIKKGRVSKRKAINKIIPKVNTEADTEVDTEIDTERDSVVDTNDELITKDLNDKLKESTIDVNDDTVVDSIEVELDKNNLSDSEDDDLLTKDDIDKKIDEQIEKVVLEEEKRQQDTMLIDDIIRNDNDEEKNLIDKIDETIEMNIKMNKNNNFDEKISSIIDKEDDIIDIEDSDDYLLYLEQILKRIHNDFYDIYDKKGEMSDLKVLIPKIRSEILVGKNLVFSGLVPNHVQLEQSRTYQIAKSMGAKITQDLTDETTHLVAATAWTVKEIAARKCKNINIVTPDWLWSCAERWECVDENLFPLDSTNRTNKMRVPPAHCHSPKHGVNYNEKNENQDDMEPKFMDTINPLLSFSNTDLAEMNQEFDQFFNSDESSSDDEPVDLENPPITKSLRKRKREVEKEESQRNFFSKDTANSNIEPVELTNIEILDDNSKQANENSSEDDDEDDIPAKFRRGGDLPSDLDMGSDSPSDGSQDPNDEDDGKWNMMGAALERDFLGLD